MNFIDMTGQIVGDFKVIKRVENCKGGARFLMQCVKCGRTKERNGAEVRSYPQQCLCDKSITFTCANCGKTVTTDNSKGHNGLDKRTRFCCQPCEKAYWRKKSKQKPTHLTVLHEWELARDVNKYDK